MLCAKIFSKSNTQLQERSPYIQCSFFYGNLYTKNNSVCEALSHNRSMLHTDDLYDNQLTCGYHGPL